MATDIKTIWLIVQVYKGPATDKGLELSVVTSSTDVELDTLTAASKGKYNQALEVNMATQYYWSYNDGDWNKGDLTTKNIKGLNLELEGSSSDTFVPQTIWVMARDVNNKVYILSNNIASPKEMQGGTNYPLKFYPINA